MWIFSFKNLAKDFWYEVNKIFLATWYKKSEHIYFFELADILNLEIDASDKGRYLAFLALGNEIRNIFRHHSSETIAAALVERVYLSCHLDELLFGWYVNYLEYLHENKAPISDSDYFKILTDIKSNITG